MLVAPFIAALTLLPGRAPPLRTADGAHRSSSSIRMVTAEPAQKSFLGKIGELNSMNKMASVKKGEKPKLRGKRLTPAMLELTGTFKKTYPAKDLEVLWAALLKVYGSAELAEQAARDNPQILNPSYSFCNTMLASADVLVNMMGREEALEVMSKNPPRWPRLRSPPGAMAPPNYVHFIQFGHLDARVSSPVTINTCRWAVQGLLWSLIQHGGYIHNRKV